MFYLYKFIFVFLIVIRICWWSFVNSSTDSSVKIFDIIYILTSWQSAFVHRRTHIFSSQSAIDLLYMYILFVLMCAWLVFKKALERALKKYIFPSFLP